MKPVKTTDYSQNQEEQHWISRAQSGDRDAFQNLVKQYQQRILSIAYRIVGNSEDARDVAQEVFIRLYRFLPQYKKEKRFFTWLYRIVVNACYDHLRKEKKYRADPLDKIPEIRMAYVPGDNVEQNEFHDKVIALLDTLSAHQKTAFLLREVEDFSCKEIAEVMGCPNSTVRSHLHYARSRLKVLLKTHYPEFFEGLKV